MALLFLSACSADDGSSAVDRLGTGGTGAATVAPAVPPGGSRGGSTVPANGPEGAAARAALRTYQDWWQAQAEAFGRSDSDGLALEAYSSGKALAGTLVNLQQLHDSDLVMIGAPRNSPVVKALDLKADPQTAEIEDCLDVTGWHQADAATRATKDPKQRLSRYIVTASLRKSEARWLIYEFKREVERTC
ncbi:hypothetical protein ACWGB8_01325 [Kitasatospora sp. NPDC054939]